MDLDETPEPIRDVAPEPTTDVVAEPEPAGRAARPNWPEPDHGRFFTEVWQGKALYRCPICRVAKTDRGGLSGDAAIRIHLERHHRPEFTPEERARAAGLVISKR